MCVAGCMHKTKTPIVYKKNRVGQQWYDKWAWNSTASRFNVSGCDTDTRPSARSRLTNYFNRKQQTTVSRSLSLTLTITTQTHSQYKSLSLYIVTPICMFTISRSMGCPVCVRVFFVLSPSPSSQSGTQSTKHSFYYVETHTERDWSATDQTPPSFAWKIKLIECHTNFNFYIHIVFLY